MNITKVLYYIIIKYPLYQLRQKIFNLQNKDKRKNIKIISKLRTHGYVVIKNYISSKNCEKIKKDINKFIQNNPKYVVIDNLKSDFRIHGAEKISKTIKSYFDSKFLKSIGENYSNNKLSNLMTMANLTKFKKQNKGSGNGWHRDGLNFQYKSILYLTDVNENNGSFQIIKNSNEKSEIVKFVIKNNLSPFETRFSNRLIEKNLKNKNLRLKTLTGKKGTLILVDTSCIHRGSPLKEGIRYAITNYYYPKNLINRYKNQFSKRIKMSIY